MTNDANPGMPALTKQQIEEWAYDGAPTPVVRALCKAWLHAQHIPQNAGQFRAAIVEPAIREALRISELLSKAGVAAEAAAQSQESRIQAQASVYSENENKQLGFVDGASWAFGQAASMNAIATDAGAVYAALPWQAQRRTSQENVADVLAAQASIKSSGS